MSIRKVSDLETVSFIDGTQNLSDINDSLLEISFPYHGDGGHSFKSVNTKYSDIRTDLLSSVFSSSVSTVFTTDVTFVSSVNMLCGLALSGNMHINANNQNWQDTNVYIKAGDMALYGYDNVGIQSNRQLNLSAKNIYAFADTANIIGFSDSSQTIATFSKSNTSLYSPLTSDSPIRIPTTVSSDTYSAVNVEYLNNEISYIKEWMQNRENQDINNFELIETKLYTNEDIVNVEYMLQKKYKYTYETEDEDGNKTTNTELFIEYEIKSKPFVDTSNKNIYFPDILDNDTMAITVSETTNMKSPKDSKVQTTVISLISMGTVDPLSGYITGMYLKSVASSESLNAHIFARVTNFTPTSDRMLFPTLDPTTGAIRKYNFKECTELAAPRYTFSTPQFLTGNHVKYMIIVEGRLGLVGVENYTNIYMYAVFTSLNSTDQTCLYSGMPQQAEYPQHERMYPQWAKTGQIIELGGTDVGGGSIKYITDATNGYYVRSGASNKVRNETTLSYPERYAYMYTCTKSNWSNLSSYNINYASEANGILTTFKSKKLSINKTYFKSLGSERVYANAGAFQFIKTFTISNTYAPVAKSMRIVFATQNTKSDQFMVVNNDLNIQVIQLD